MSPLFPFSGRARELDARLAAFMAERVLPAEAEVHAWQQDSGQRWTVCPRIEALKLEAKAEDLWNLFLPDATHGAGLSNLDYAPLAERMGRVLWASEVFNCNAPDTGNMEVLAHFGSPAQQSAWLAPLLRGEIRSAFAMTEPDVASSDATNIALSIRREGGEYVLNGRKWWIIGAGDPRCRLLIVMGVTTPRAEPHARHAMVLVPMGTPGLRVVRSLEAFGHDDAPVAMSNWNSPTCACRRRTWSAAKARASRSRRPGSAPAASTTACAWSAWRSARWR